MPQLPNRATELQCALFACVARGLSVVAGPPGAVLPHLPDGSPVQTLSPDGWAALLDEAQLHGVHGLVHAAVRHLPDIPDQAAQALEAVHQREQRRAIRLSAELLRLLELFEGHGIPVMPIKGPILAQRVYGNLGRRSFWDLDLLLPQDAIETAGDLLARDGFEAEERWDARRLRRELRANCEQNFDHPARDVHVELHWRFVPRSIGFALPVDGLWQRAGEIGFMGRTVRVPDLYDELLTLTIHHGAKHGWERLRMVTDVSLLVTRIVHESPGDPTEAVQALIRRSEDAGVRRLLSTGIVMAHSLLDAPVHPELLGWATNNPQVNRLADRATGRLLQFTGETPEDGLGVLIAYLHSRERTSDRLRYLPRTARAVFTPTEHEQQLMPLPRGLRGLHVIVRLPRLLFKYLRRVLRARTAPG